MKALFVVTAIIVAVAALIFLLLLGKASINIAYEDELKVEIKYLFFKLRIFPTKNKKNKKKSEKTKDGKASEKNAADNSEDVPIKKKNEGKKSSVKETTELIFAIIKRIFKIVGNHGEICVKKLLITVSCEDACDTAVRFGIMCSALGAGIALCKLFGKSEIREKNVGVIPDFISGKSKVAADITVSVRAIYLVLGLIGVLWDKIKSE